MNYTIGQKLAEVSENLKECLDIWVQIEGTIANMERELKYFPFAAQLKKAVSS